MTEAVGLLVAGKLFSINLIMDSKQRVIRLFCGNIVNAPWSGCDLVDSIYRVGLRGLFDCAIVLAGYTPLTSIFPCS